MRVELVLSVACDSSATASRLEDVLAPDNTGIPRGQRFSMSRDGKEVRFDIVTSSPSSALSTVKSILRDITLFREISLLSR